MPWSTFVGTTKCRDSTQLKELKPDIYMITNGAYESVFVTTGRGVVLFDAPPSFAQHIVQAVAETTSEPIVQLVYSHIHVDYIGGAASSGSKFPSSKSWGRMAPPISCTRCRTPKEGRGQ